MSRAFGTSAGMLAMQWPLLLQQVEPGCPFFVASDGVEVVAVFGDKGEMPGDVMRVAEQFIGTPEGHAPSSHG